MSEAKEQKKGKPAKDGKGGKEAQPAKQPKQPKQAKGEGKEARAEKPQVETVEKPSRPAGSARLQVYYRENVVKDLTQQFGYKSVMQVPRIEKIVLNMGVGEAVADKKIMDNAVADMTTIAGQRP